jgi:hypothetical protein
VRLDGALIAAEYPIRELTFVVPGVRKFVPVADKQVAAPSFLRFAAIQGVERKQNLAVLAPRGCFIPAETVEREVGQIGET